MEKTIPILPCSSMTEQIEFYKALGFELIGQYTRSYLVFRYGEIELHFYGTKQVQPHENSAMCNIRTDNLERLYDAFTEGLKMKTAKIPRSGFPKITKIRDLNEDRRFTLTDPSGNTFYITTPKVQGSKTFFRDIDHEQSAELFSVLYDLVYSKEDLKVANNLLPRLIAEKELFSDLDRAKLLLLAMEIHDGLGIAYDDAELKRLIGGHGAGDDWQRIESRLLEIRKQSL